MKVFDKDNYLYSGQELQEFAGPVGELVKHTGELHLLFNNCYRDNVQRNALELKAPMKP